MEEPRYVDDEELFGLPPRKKTKRKFQIPNSEFQRRMLITCKKKYFSEKREEEYSPTREIEKSMVSLETGIVGKYPTEWVDNCIEWANKKFREGAYISLKSLLSLIQNQDKKTEFVTRWQKQHPNKRVYDLDSEDQPTTYKLD